MAKALMLSCLAVVLLVGFLEATPRTPNVQVYSRYPVEKGTENIVNCYVDNFHPPKINITIEKGGKPLDVKQSDLSFDKTWAFNRLVYAKVTPDGEDVACRVEHSTLAGPKVVKWEQE
ncbi:beta-2-microglobulin isoform X2 [Podarcis raffonei]|uniref:beta-2-microglobulin isoform X2 n=1 Tax=Podarcis raffonei TaxID=65483 RepID=UPI0023295D5E|nr:beta-2-microglobulin isoform X2 [Podarcis raffonei]